LVLEVGQVIDRYKIEGCIGSGGMATVYRVRHTLLGSLHALKVLHPELLRHDEIRERFLAEGRIQAQLFHPHIAAVTDLVSAEGVAGLVMEYLEGQTLEQWMVERGPATAREALDLLRPVLAAVGHAHRAGVVHRDLKPSNLFLCSRTIGMVRPVVLDFGVAKLKEEAGVTAFRSRPTATGTRIGTVHYMSPEQVRTSAGVDERSDLYALGAVLYEILIGRAPFDGDNEFEVMQRIVAGTYEDPAQHLPAGAGPLVSVLRTALALNPDERFADTEAFRTALEAAVLALPIEVPKVVRAPAAEPVAVPAVARRAVVLWPGASAEKVVPLGEHRVLIDPVAETIAEMTKKRRIASSHALIVPDAEGWVLEVHGRTFPTLVDGVLVRAPRRLFGGEQILVGHLRLRFEAG
jgi:serine/threonine protein kinase